MNGETPHPASGPVAALAPARSALQAAEHADAVRPGRSGESLPRAERELSSEEGFITKEVVAERLCLTPRTVERWARSGRLPAHWFGRRVRFKWSAVRAALANKTKGNDE